MPDYLDLMRFRNDGDEFHVLWTARRALRMLDPTSRLVAVAVEEVSTGERPEGDGLEAGLLVIDTAEYYGSEIFELPDGKTRRVQFLGGNDLYDPDQPAGVLTYSFDKRLVDVLRTLTIWGRIVLPT